MTRLHQTWKTLTPPPRFDAWRESWLIWNPTLTIHTWDDVGCLRFVFDHEPTLLATYQSLPAHIMRVDMIRYIWMKHLGGIYADLDVECLQPMGILMKPGAHLIMEKMGPKDDTIGNACMASTRGDPFWTHVLEILADRARRMLWSWKGEAFPQRCHSVLRITGPYMLTDALSLYSGKATVHKESEAGIKHHGTGTWWRDGVVL